MIDKLLQQQHNDVFSLMDSFPNAGSVSSSSSSSYELFTPQSIQRNTKLQKQYDSDIIIQQENNNPSFDVNIIHCSLENSPKHTSLYVYWVWIDFLINGFLPFTVMIVCTIIIILTLVRSSTRATGSTSANRNISIMLITVNLVFITLAAPIVIFLSVYEYIKDEANDYRQVILILIKMICLILMHLNHSVNIIIYSITAKEFRTEMTNFFQ